MSRCQSQTRWITSNVSLLSHYRPQQLGRLGATFLEHCGPVVPAPYLFTSSPLSLFFSPIIPVHSVLVPNTTLACNLLVNWPTPWSVCGWIHEFKQYVCISVWNTCLFLLFIQYFPPFAINLCHYYNCFHWDLTGFCLIPHPELHDVHVLTI